MSVRRLVVILAAALLVPAPLGASPAAAKRAPSPPKQVNQAFRLLIKDTRLLPKRAVKKPRKAALLRTAKKAKRQARRRPCASLKTLRT